MGQKHVFREENRFGSNVGTRSSRMQFVRIPVQAHFAAFDGQRISLAMQVFTEHVETFGQVQDRGIPPGTGCLCVNSPGVSLAMTIRGLVRGAQVLGGKGVSLCMTRNCVK